MLDEKVLHTHVPSKLPRDVRAFQEEEEKTTCTPMLMSSTKKEVKQREWQKVSKIQRVKKG